MRKVIMIFFVTLVLASYVGAQAYMPVADIQKENDVSEQTDLIQKAQTNFQDMKFGIFLHWGLYSMLGQGEWVMHNRNIDYREYSKLAAGFYPSAFDAEQWVKSIKASGAKYITFTTRHHDGFSMWHTNASDFNVVQATPFKQDILKELSDACHRNEISLHIYYSHLDWSRLDYVLGETGRGTGRPTGHHNWSQYLNFMNTQLTELLTDYGPIGAVWFDGLWDHKNDMTPEDWGLQSQYELIHSLQPSCLIANNHHLVPFSGENIQIFERDLPGENKAGFSGESGVSRHLPLETCETMNHSWGYYINDDNYKSVKELIHLLVGAAGRNANFLLNIGPEPGGQLPSRAVELLQEMGQWLSKYGETIYSTRGGEVEPHPWGVTTRNGNRLFVHILNLQDKQLFIPIMTKVNSACEYLSRKAVKMQRVDGGVVLSFDMVPSEIDYVIELECKPNKTIHK